MLSRVEGCDVDAFGCKASEENVQFLHQRGVSISHCEVVGFVAGDVLHPLPHLPRLVAVEMFLYPPLVCCLGLSDASPQAASGSTVLCSITTSEGLVSLLQQDPDLSSPFDLDRPGCAG